MADERDQGPERGGMTASPASQTSPDGAGQDAAQDTGRQASAIADEARERAEGARDEVAGRAGEAAEAGRERAADGLHDAASRLREQEDRLPGQVAERTADGIERTAAYLRSHDTNEIRAEVEHYVREHPIQGVAAAIAAGFLIGRVLR